MPVRTAIAGIGGFGAAHHEVFEILEAQKRTRIVATCDPILDRLGEICEQYHFSHRGVKTYRTFEEILDTHRGQLDLGVVAAPFQFHSAMHEALVRDQIACYMEKPPTLDPQELQEMLNVEKNAAIATNVGFAYVDMPDRLNLKCRILNGEFGKLKKISFLGLSHRGHSYFQRNNWAGRLMVEGKLILDSCLGNAMAHFVNSMLFFANQNGLQAWARPIEMSCEMYRANRIEGADTIFATGRLDNGIEFGIAASHACLNQEAVIEETMEFEGASIAIHDLNDVSVRKPGKALERFSIAKPTLIDCVGHYLEYLSGSRSRPSQTLNDCQGFVEMNALFYLAANQIHDLPRDAVVNRHDSLGVALDNVERAGRRLVVDAVLPSKADYPWARPGGESTVKNLPHLRAIVEAMLNGQR